MIKPERDKSCRILVGTSGYSYTEWIDGGFYPPGTGSREMLSWYAKQFPATELNYTWYQMPRAQTVERMQRKVPEDFCFAAKLTRTMTHEVDSEKWRGQVTLYRNGIAPLLQTGRLLAVLIQLPPFFNRSKQNRLYLAKLLDALSDLPLAVEFRHVSWAHDRVFAALEARNVALVCVDAPDLSGLFPRLNVVTSSNLFYIRFHGRNTTGWHSGNMQKQFDYDYSEQELKEWSENKIPEMAGKTTSGIIFFNNHVRGQAPKNAQILMSQINRS